MFARSKFSSSTSSGADHPVDVGSDVDVRVEELGPVRNEARGLGLVELDEALGPFPHVREGHGLESY